MIGIDIHGSTLITLSATPSAAQFTNGLSGGWYEVKAKTSDIYVKTIEAGGAETITLAGGDTIYQIWRGNTRRVRVRENGKIGVICLPGEPAMTVEINRVWAP